MDKVREAWAYLQWVYNDRILGLVSSIRNAGNL